MRRILFRGKAVDTGEWVYGYYSGPVGACECYEICNINDVLGSMVDIDPATLGQHTGVTDKSGKAVYEGDTLLVDGYPDFPLYIDFNIDRGMFCFKSMKNIHYISTMLPGNRFVVTGNIHDNPELLDGGSYG